MKANVSTATDLWSRAERINSNSKGKQANSTYNRHGNDSMLRFWRPTASSPLNRRLLLRDAVDAAEAFDEVDRVEAHHTAVG